MRLHATHLPRQHDRHVGRDAPREHGRRDFVLGRKLPTERLKEQHGTGITM